MGGWRDSVSPGCLYDLTLLGADNDQLTVFSPSNQRGPVSHVRLVEDGAQGKAVIEVLVSAATHDGVEIRHVYRLKDDWHGLVVETYLDNQSSSDFEWDPADQWKPNQDRMTAANIITWDEPDKLDWKEIFRHAKAGRMMMTTGPFLEVQTEGGQISGGATRARGSIGLKVKVQCTDWVQIDRIQVLVNSRKVPALNYTRKTHPEWFGDGVVQFDQHL